VLPQHSGCVRTCKKAGKHDSRVNHLELVWCMCCLQEDARPEPCNENLIINELIREYLIFNGYRDTLSVFLPGACC
jgi:hypothetical protein